MTVFVDTSAFYALLVRTESGHKPTRLAFESLLKKGTTLHTSSYILVETIALLQSRIGLNAVHDFDEDMVPLLTISWVDATLHRRALARLKRESRRRLSLVDCSSFEIMRSEGIDNALTLDRHFKDFGFKLLPKI
jgi:predicted nucleic acid-binding protein